MPRTPAAAKSLELVPELEPLARAFTKDPAVVHYKATSLCVGRKVFAMLVKGELVLKLPAARAQALVEAGEGRLHVLGARVMTEWLCVAPARKARWVALARESRDYVGE